MPSSLPLCTIDDDFVNMTYRPHKHIPDKERVIAGYKVSCLKACSHNQQHSGRDDGSDLAALVFEMPLAPELLVLSAEGCLEAGLPAGLAALVEAVVTPR